MPNIPGAVTINASVVAADPSLTMYGTPAIVGESTYATKDTPKKYTSLASVGTDHGTSSKIYLAAAAIFAQGVRNLYAVAISAATPGSPTATEVETALATLANYARDKLIHGVCLAGIHSDSSTLTAKLKTFADTYSVIFTVTNPNGATAATIAAAIPALSSANGYFVAHADADQTGDVAAAALGRISVLKPWVTPYWKEVTCDVNAFFTPDDLRTLEAARANCIVDLKNDGTTRFSEALTTQVDDEPRYLDITRLKYYMVQVLQTAIADYRIAAEKIPYTATGLKFIGSEIKNAMEGLVSDGALAEYTITLPNIDDIDEADKAQRRVTGISIWARNAGDMQGFTIPLTLEAI